MLTVVLALLVALQLVTIAGLIVMARRRLAADLAPVVGRLDHVERLQERLERSVRDDLARQRFELREQTEAIRTIVDAELHGTLERRLGESFSLVSERLEQVHKGLGEMQTLAAGVGDLKRVLTNVKTRGTWGEVQLGTLLEQMLAPGQYARDVCTKGEGAERVEYAVRLPGKGRGTNGSDHVWLPIDAKFPQEDYCRLVEAGERGDVVSAELASRQFEVRLRQCASDIATKYIAPPMTTDFGIMFLPTEGLYAEAVRRTGLAESLQREFRVALAGPTTLAALLNSLQMGFRAFAIEQRSSEVWEVLSEAKTEFRRYADVLERIKRKLHDATTAVDTASQRTRAIERKLRRVEVASQDPQQPLSPAEPSRT